VLVAADHGLDVQVVNRMTKATADHPGTVWITRDPAVESIGQLRGARIGVPASTGQLTDSVVYLLQRAGVAKEQVTFVQTPFATMLDQLNAGRLDAAVAGAPFSTVMAAQGYRLHDDVVVSAVREASGGARDDGMTSLFASSSAFASTHPEAMRAWQESLHEAVDRLRNDDAEWRAELRSWLKMPPEVAGTASLPVWELDVTPADLQPYVTIARSVGSVEHDPDVNALVWQDHP
jgi:NitT/TauT family transport system substrate-binding protein